MKVAHLSEPAEERVIFRDGLGVRERRTSSTGEVVEWFHLAPAFATVEAPLRERVTRLSKFQHVKFARIFGLEPGAKDRGPIIVSDHVVGTRLVQVLDAAGLGLITFDPGAGLQVTREVLGGLSVLHDSRNVSHGALGPERVLLTPTGRVVMADHVLAQALDRLQRPRHQMWREWRVATPPAPGTARFDMQTDLAQAGVLALAVLLGRPLEEDEYPHRLRGLLPLVHDRLARSPAAGITADVVAWLERLAPLDSRRPFKTVREAQQVFEALVAGNASAMGVTHTRVKAVLSAMAALAAEAPAGPAAGAAPSPSAPNRTPPFEEARPVSALRPDPLSVSTDTTSAASDDSDIDIEALLALEAELEGGSAPSSAPAEGRSVPSSSLGARRPAVTPAPPPASVAPERQPMVPAPEPIVMEVAAETPAPPVEPERPVADTGTLDMPAPALETISQERLDLERQFAALVDIVAPGEHTHVPFMPPPPPTSESLVDARVRWSSMPADVADTVSTSAPEMSLSDEVVAEPVSIYAAVEPDLPETDSDPAPLQGPEVLFAVEPIVVFRAEVPPPTTGAAAVSADWWKDALPWRSGEAAAETMEAVDTLDALDVAEDVALASDIPAPAALDAADVLDPQPVADAEPEPETEALGEPAAQAIIGMVVAAPEEEALDAAAEAWSAPLGHMDLPLDLEAENAVDAPGDADEVPIEEPARPVEEPALAAEALVPHVPAAVVSDAEEVIDAAVAPVLAAPTEADVFARAPIADVAPDAIEGARPVAPVDEVLVDPSSQPADDSLGGDDAAEPVSGYRLFGDIEPIVLQADTESPPADVPFSFGHVDEGPRAAATALLAHAGGNDHSPGWRETFLDVSSDEAHAASAASVFFAHRAGDESSETQPDASTDLVEVPPAGLAVEHVVSGALAESQPDVAWLPTMPPLDEGVVAQGDPPDHEEPVMEPEPQPEPPVEADSEPQADPEQQRESEVTPETPAEVERLTVPEVVIVDDDEARDAWDALTSEQPQESRVTDAAEDDGPAAVTPEVMTAHTSAAKRKRRSRRKKGARKDEGVASPVASPVPDVPPPVEMPAGPATTADIGRDGPSRSRSLLDRAVPAWTPPADLGQVPSQAAYAQPAAAVAALADTATGNDDRDTGPSPVAVMLSGEAVVPVPATSGPGPISNPMTVPQVASHHVPPTPHPVDALRHFEPEIRAVGMPDLDDLASRSGHASITSMADAIGPTPMTSTRPSASESHGAEVPHHPDSSRGSKLRRVLAASLLLALFQGAAFAAWWWVQPGASGTLVVQTTRIGVEVLLDDKVVGRTPFREEVAPGRHKLGLRQGASVREMPVEISVGVVTTQSVDWPSTAGGKGNLQITSSPTGAEVFIEGKSRGTAPLLLEHLPAGDQSLMLRSDAGSVNVTATVIADETTPLDVKIFAGWILVDAPVEVNLLLRGRDRIGSSMDGQILLPPGTHRVQAVNEALGIRQWLTVTVEPGAVNRVPFVVQPATLTLQEESEVFVDGASAGTTPGTISIAPGTHDIAIRRPDGAERRQAMTVRSGQRIEF